MLQLTATEWAALRSQIVILKGEVAALTIRQSS